MTIRTFALAGLASILFVGSAMAEDRIDLTPPLYRDQARATASVRPASELTTTPSLTPVASNASLLDVETTASVR